LYKYKSTVSVIGWIKLSKLTHLQLLAVTAMSKCLRYRQTSSNFQTVVKSVREPPDNHIALKLSHKLLVPSPQTRF